jgi:hypothetical protein
MKVSEEEKRRRIDLHFNQGKTIREVCRLLGKSSHEITPVTKEHRIRLTQNYALANGEKGDILQYEQDAVIPNVKAYKLFDEGKSPLEVASELNLPGPQVQQFYIEPEQIMKLIQMADDVHRLQEKLGDLQSELLDISKRRTVSKGQLKDL